MAVTKVSSPECAMIVFTAETFTADVSAASAQAVAANERMHIIGWTLTVTSNSANAVCQIKDSAGTVYAETRFVASGTHRGDWTVDYPASGVGFSLASGAELVIGGGGTAGVLSGVVWYAIRSA